MNKWQEEFNKEYKDQPLNIWCIGFVAMCIVYGSVKEITDGENCNFITKILEDKFKEKDKEIKIADDRWKSNEECRIKLADLEQDNNINI